MPFSPPSPSKVLFNVTQTTTTTNDSPIIEVLFGENGNKNNNNNEDDDSDETTNDSPIIEVLFEDNGNKNNNNNEEDDSETAKKKRKCSLSNYKPFCSSSTQSSSSSTQSSSTSLQNEILCAMDKIKTQDHAAFSDMVSFFRQVNQDKYPLDQVTYSLFLDTVRWYETEFKNTVRYRDVTKDFALTGDVLFHGQFHRFCQGDRSGHINLPWPSQTTLDKFFKKKCNLPKIMSPGIVKSTFALLKNSPDASKKTYVGAMDGKKTAMGLTESGGDVDMFGCEDGLTVKDRNERLEKEIQCIKEFRNDSVAVASSARKAAKLVSMRLKDIRATLMARNNTLRKFLKWSGGNWRKSKWLYVISTMYTHVTRIQAAITKALHVIGQLHLISSHANGQLQLSVSSGSTTLDLTDQLNYVTLKKPDALPVSHQDKSEFIKQGTDEWKALREKAKVTGSTSHRALGLCYLKTMKEHMEFLKTGKLFMSLLHVHQMNFISRKQ